MRSVRFAPGKTTFLNFAFLWKVAELMIRRSWLPKETSPHSVQVQKVSRIRFVARLPTTRGILRRAIAASDMRDLEEEHSTTEYPLDRTRLYYWSTNFWRR